MTDQQSTTNATQSAAGQQGEPAIEKIVSGAVSQPAREESKDPGPPQVESGGNSKPVGGDGPPAAARQSATATGSGAEKPQPAETSAPDVDEDAIKAKPQAWRVYEAAKKRWRDERERLEARLKELEAKPAPSAADEQKMRDLERRIAEFESRAKTYAQQLAEVEYTRSDEFKEKYAAPWQRTYKEGVDFVSALRKHNELGEPGDERGSQSDFDMLRSLPREQRRLEAKRMFGEDAPEVLEYIRQLDRIRADADAAVAEHGKQYESKKQEEERRKKEELDAFAQHHQRAREAIEAKFPQFFSPAHYASSPAEKKALEDSYQYVDWLSESLQQMPADERAAAAAVLRARAAGFGLLVARAEKLEAENKALKDELAKFRSTDPGAAAGASGGQSADKRVSIDTAAAEFDV
jgi:hypothetical protein